MLFNLKTSVVNSPKLPTWFIWAATLVSLLGSGCTQVDNPSESFCRRSEIKNSENKMNATASTFGNPAGWSNIKRVFMVVLENTDQSVASVQPYISELGRNGAVLLQSYAITHPSQPNYLALISGDLHGINSNRNVELNSRHLGDLLEEQGKRWKVYAEDFPGACFQGPASGNYRRKNNPFMSFRSVNHSLVECSHIVPGDHLETDVKSQTLPEFSLYIPNGKNSGHDTDVAFADNWLAQKFDPLFKDNRFMDGTLFILTFDEGSESGNNQIHTVYYGAGVTPGSNSMSCYDHYSTLATVEKVLGVGNLGREDTKAAIVDDIWKK